VLRVAARRRRTSTAAGEGEVERVEAACFGRPPGGAERQRRLVRERLKGLGTTVLFLSTVESD
jgi:hypothetical protein